ncbi:MAG: hypothetical protein FJ077_10550 [Cyanobacteria bacterium K_DeepCast_35m_m2_023]|nr:hypothetical protein [Cyanobacteria bacterium K_DeepCast_35m_m2_023]
MRLPSGSLIKPFSLLGVYAIACLFWLPSLQDVATPEADQVFHYFWFSVACRAGEVSLGSLGGTASAGQPEGLFALSLLAKLQQDLSCRLASRVELNPAQVYLLGALLILVVLSYISARQAGFSHRARLLMVFTLATAPCSFSRLGHLDQTVLIAVAPTLMACWQLRCQMVRAVNSSISQRVLLSGFMAAAMTYPAQEYYVVFSVLLVTTLAAITWLELSAKVPSLRELWRPSLVAILFMAGFLLMLALAFLPKLLAVSSAGPPRLWMTPRLATEQLLYGLMPMTWFVPPNVVEPVRAALRDAGFAVQLESYFWSAGSLLIPIALVAAVRCLMVPVPVRLLPMEQRRRFFARLLLVVVFLALVVMTIGGLGTLFATFVSPVLRSLNRFTVFVYGAAVVYLISECDCWCCRETTH